jgi:fructokinase
LQEFKGRVVGVKVDAVDTTGAGDAFVGGILNILTSDPNLYKVQLNTSFAFE